MRQILTLRYIGRKSWQQIAEALDVDGDGSTERKSTTGFCGNSANKRRGERRGEGEVRFP